MIKKTKKTLHYKIVGLTEDNREKLQLLSESFANSESAVIRLAINFFYEELQKEKISRVLPTIQIN